MKLQALRNMLVDGAHVGEGEAFETDKSTGTLLINMKKAVDFVPPPKKAEKKAA